MSHLERLHTTMLGIQMQLLEGVSLQFASIQAEAVRIAGYNIGTPPLSGEDLQSLATLSQKLDGIVLTMQQLQCFNVSQDATETEKED